MSDILSIPIRSDKLRMEVKIKEKIVDIKSDFQRIEIFDTEVFGKLLLLDGHIQLTEMDESAYHEMLIHVPLLSINQPVSVLVVGGGDGGVLREICKHQSIEHIDMVEIDEKVIQICKEHLPNVSASSFEDKRINLVIADAFDFVKNTKRKYDLIVVDCTDVYEEADGSLSEQLFTKTFYEDCYSATSEQGIIVSQADNLLFCPYSLDSIQDAFGDVYPLTGSYWALIPSFGGFSGYCWASKSTKIPEQFPSSKASHLELDYLNETTYKLAMSGLPFRS